MSDSINMASPRFQESVIRRIWAEVGGSLQDKFIAVLLKYSNEKDDIAIAETEWCYLSVNRDEPSQCICSHEIEERHFIKNKYNSNVLRIGSECINRFLGDGVKQDTKLIKQQLAYEKNGNGSHRLCSSCKRHSIPISTEDWVKICKSCYKKRKITGENIVVTESLPLLNGRNCTVCLRPTIPVGAEEFKTKCQQCWKKSLETKVEGRECQDCKQHNIPLSSEKYVVRCYKCYAKSKGNQPVKKETSSFSSFTQSSRRFL